MTTRLLVLAAFLGLLTACTQVPRQPDRAAARQQVIDTERAFARTMAERDHRAFLSFLSEEAVFLSGAKPLRGKEAIGAWWKRYYEKPTALFSWEPAQVQVLESGTLALSTGPVRDGHGRLIGTFTSVWRLEAPGAWRIIFDKGNAACEPAEK